MVRAVLLVLALGVAAGCPSGSRGGGGTGTGPGTATAGAVDAGTVAPADADAATSTSLTPAECERLIDHVLAVQITKMRAELPPEKVPTDEQVAKIRATMGVEMMDPCLTGYDRAAYTCMLAATTVEALYACATAPAE